MINYAELDTRTYDIFKDKDGVVYSVGIAERGVLIKIQKIRFVISDLNERYDELKNVEDSKSKFDEMDKLYSELNDVMYEMFLLILNLNQQGKVFTLDDIKMLPVDCIVAECEGYVAFVESIINIKDDNEVPE